MVSTFFLSQGQRGAEKLLVYSMMAPRFGHRGPVPGSRPAAVPQATLPTTALRWQSGQFHAQLTAETGMVSRVFVAKKTRLLEGHTRAVSRRPSAGECNGRKEPADSGPVRTSSTRKLGDFQKRAEQQPFSRTSWMREGQLWLIHHRSQSALLPLTSPSSFLSSPAPTQRERVLGRERPAGVCAISSRGTGRKQRQPGPLGLGRGRGRRWPDGGGRRSWPEHRQGREHVRPGHKGQDTPEARLLLQTCSQQMLSPRSSHPLPGLSRAADCKCRLVPSPLIYCSQTPTRDAVWNRLRSLLIIFPL